MSKIQINDVKVDGAELFNNSETFLNEFEDSELDHIVGGSPTCGNAINLNISPKPIDFEPIDLDGIDINPDFLDIINLQQPIDCDSIDWNPTFGIESIIFGTTQVNH